MSSNPSRSTASQRPSKSGAYKDPDEVIDQALEMLSERDAWITEHRAELSAKIEAGYAAAQRGELVDEDQVRANLEKRKRAWLAEDREA